MPAAKKQPAEPLEDKIDRLSARVEQLSGRINIGVAARVAIIVAVALSLLGTGVALDTVWTQGRQRTQSRHNFCLNENAAAERAIGAAVNTAEAKARDLIRISGTDPNTALAKAFIQGQRDVTEAEYRRAFPLRSCTPTGEAEWANNPPDGATATSCPSNGKGYCR